MDEACQSGWISRLGHRFPVTVVDRARVDATGADGADLEIDEKLIDYSECGDADYIYESICQPINRYSAGCCSDFHQLSS